MKILIDNGTAALAAWRTLDQETQTLWHEYGTEAVPHKPPFDNQAHISGQNLFVSAYPGFVTLGDEHIPTPQRFVKFPPFAVRMDNDVRVNGSLVISTVVTMAEGLDAGRYRLLAKLLLTEPGKGRHPGLLRNYLADANCDAAQIRVTVPGYTEQVGFELEQIQVRAQYILIDNVTGFRSQSHQQSFILSVR